MQGGSEKFTLNKKSLTNVRLFAEWTGLEPMPYTPQFQYFSSLQIKNSRLTPV